MNTREFPLSSWRPTMEAGPKKAIPVKPEGAARIIRRAEKVALAIGARITENEKLMDYVERLHNAGMTIIATAHTIKYTSERGIKAHKAGVVEATNLLTDPQWEGFDGQGKPDLLLVMGINLDLENQTFESLKNYSEVKGMCTDRYSMINAYYTFPTLTEELWLEYLEKLCKELGV